MAGKKHHTQRPVSEQIVQEELARQFVPDQRLR